MLEGIGHAASLPPGLVADQVKRSEQLEETWRIRRIEKARKDTEASP